MSEAGPSIPGVKHKVIALLSGGKDSCFNLLHCEANGHEVVAIATLTPEEGVDELDSHLYQSVGTRLLPLMARAADLPLHTRVIRGKAVELGPEYGSRSGGIGKGKGKGKEGDETEDLYELLQERAHPDATALSSGAILSNYQRLRIEHVCSRLGLVSLSYLWQQPQLPLLRSMLACGMEVVLVKVAGVGLTDKLVGRQLGQVMPLLTKLEQMYGSHPAGEGGEYETITLSSPLWSHRLVLKSTEVIITDPGEYPVAYLRVDDAELEEKEAWTRPTVQQVRDMLRLPPNTRDPLGDSDGDEDEMALLGTEPAGLDGTSRGIYQQALLAAEADSESSSEAESSSMALERLRLGPSTPSQQYEKPHARLSRRGRWVVAAVDGYCSTSDEPIDSEIKRAFDTLSSALDAEGLSLSLHAAHITFLLSSMAFFAPANAVYASYFGVSPPSRATVAVPLPSNQRIRLEVVCFDDRPDRKHPDAMGRIGGRQALHVQGLSYWAPANIGPYSQAVVVNSRVHLAGQIPLIPASLTLPEPSPSVSPYPLQSALALQHVRRVLDLLRSKQSTGGGWVGWCESVIAWWATPPDEPDVDGSAIVRAAWAASELAGETPVAFVQAAELPRGALVEYQVNLHTGRPGVVDNVVSSATRSSEEDDDDEDLQPVLSSVVTDNMRWEVCGTSRRGQGSRAMLFAAGPLERGDARDIVEAFIDNSAVGIKLYHQDEGAKRYDSDELAKHLLPDFLPTSRGATAPCVTLVPVRSIVDRTGRKWPFVMEIFGA